MELKSAPFKKSLKMLENLKKLLFKKKEMLYFSLIFKKLGIFHCKIGVLIRRVDLKGKKISFVLKFLKGYFYILIIYFSKWSCIKRCIFSIFLF